MMDGKKIGEMLSDVHEAMPKHAMINAGGNLGGIFIGLAISEHAKALQSMADAINKASELFSEEEQ